MTAFTIDGQHYFTVFLDWGMTSWFFTIFLCRVFFALNQWFCLKKLLVLLFQTKPSYLVFVHEFFSLRLFNLHTAWSDDFQMSKSDVSCIWLTFFDNWLVQAPILTKISLGHFVRQSTRAPCSNPLYSMSDGHCCGPKGGGTLEIVLCLSFMPDTITVTN